ncbi:MAG: hypothetical protein KDD25_07090, partial [Bdellovibrionales bacterium]|nr:hypothetical protein [Bdellovibrionales bacterium]
MRLRSTYLFVVALAVIAVGAGFLGESAMAQSSQYKRPSKSSAPSVETNTEKQPSPTSVKKKSNKKSDEKVDISDLEDKYWMAKDTEFKVVQNRLYSKAGRFNLSAQFGSIINDGFSVGNILNLGVGYYFSERLGTEITYSHYMLKDSKMTSNFDSEFGATPDFNRFQSYVGASLQWV